MTISRSVGQPTTGSLQENAFEEDEAIRVALRETLIPLSILGQRDAT